MAEKLYTVLFLCTGNSARSILGEAILNRIGEGRFEALSSGSHPKGEVNPGARRLLERLSYDASAFRSKSWGEFGQTDSPNLDFIFTVCDDAAGESCPIWPGHPMTIHWGIADPARATGSLAEIDLAFDEAYRLLHQRITAFVSLPIATLDEKNLGARLREIGRAQGATNKARDQE
jgi:arsenate reductase (thioredoxin)